MTRECQHCGVALVNQRRWYCDECRLLKRKETYKRCDKKRPPYSPEQRHRRAQYRRQHIRENLLYQARYRARKQGLDFDLDLEDICVPEKCPYLGVKLRVATNAKGPRYNSPTLDRINNKQGYVKGNVEVISYRANTLKRDLTLREMLTMGQILVQRAREYGDGASS